MPSSTSSSSFPLRLWLLVLLVGCALLSVVFEISASILLRHGLTRQRLERQRAAVDHPEMRAARLPAARVLLVGNSLLADDLDEPLLLTLSRPELDVRPLFLEATAY